DLVTELISAGPYASVNADWYPDGQKVSVWAKHPKDGWTFITAPLSGAAPVRSAISSSVREQLKAATITLDYFAWAPSRRYLYFEGRTADAKNIWRVMVNPTSLAWTGGLERLTASTETASDMALSSDGTTLAFTVRTVRTRLWS